MSDNRAQRDFYLTHIFGPRKGKIQILNRNKQEVGFLKIKPFSKLYPLYFHDSYAAILTIREKPFSPTIYFEIYWGEEIVENQYVGNVKRKKSSSKIIYDFDDEQNNDTKRINSNFSGSKIWINKDLKIKKKGKHTFFIKIDPEIDDSRTIIYLAISSYFLMLYDLQNTI
ncbi:MAG: hypothetical protein JW776_11970 [Candidatus Lokiarchaeota archaeon]|nr:hypothetical protein [Candidatus Lokiarchaeota archaeon]